MFRPFIFRVSFLWWLDVGSRHSCEFFFLFSPRLLISDVQSMSTGSNLIPLDFCWLYYIKYYGVKQCCGIRLSEECISAWKRTQDDTRYVVHKMNQFKRFLPKPCIVVVCSLIGELCKHCLMQKTILAIEELRGTGNHLSGQVKSNITW